jgi:hypothetical protein
MPFLRCSIAYLERHSAFRWTTSLTSFEITASGVLQHFPVPDVKILKFRRLDCSLDQAQERRLMLIVLTVTVCAILLFIIAEQFISILFCTDRLVSDALRVREFLTRDTARYAEYARFGIPSRLGVGGWTAV